MTRVGRLVLVLLLNLSLVGALIVVGVTAHSLGVWAAGVDYLADAGAIAVSLLAIWLSKRPPTAKRPRGYRRATTYAALINATWLIVLTLFVIVTAVARLAGGTGEVRGRPVLVMSAIAAAVMILGALILGGDTDSDDDQDGDVNMAAVLLDTIADAAAAAGVALAGAVILVSGGYYWLDPLVALVIALIIGYHGTQLTRQVLARLVLLRHG